MQSGLKTRRITGWWAWRAAKVAMPSAQAISRPPSRRLSGRQIGAVVAVVLAGAGIAGGLVWRHQRSLSLHQRACAGDAEAQYLFGQGFLARASSPEESIPGLEWMHKAAEQGHAKAQTTLGMLSAKGTGGPQALESALFWLTKAAEQGEPLAQNELATMYAKGWGVPQDLLKAIHWYSRAAASGSPEARRNLVLASANQTGTIGDIATRSGKRYSQVSLRKIEPDGITVAFALDKGGVGFAKLKLEDLPESLTPLCTRDAGGSHDDSGFKWSELELAAGRL